MLGETINSKASSNFASVMLRVRRKFIYLWSFLKALSVALKGRVNSE
jgi:hypothetical protein